MDVVSLILCLIFSSIVMKIDIKSLPDVRYSYSGIFDGGKGFDVVCDFRSAPFFSQTERMSSCVNSLIDVSVIFALLF